MTDQQASGNVSVIVAVDGYLFESGKNKAAKREEWAPLFICSVHLSKIQWPSDLQPHLPTPSLQPLGYAADFAFTYSAGGVIHDSAAHSYSTFWILLKTVERGVKLISSGCHETFENMPTTQAHTRNCSDQTSLLLRLK